MLKQSIRPAVVLFLSMTVITGFLYPLAVTAFAKIAYPAQAAGSLIERDSKVIGSKLIGQSFSDPKYFLGRPSATGPVPYNAAASSGSNQGPLNPALTDAVKARVAALRAADPENYSPVPIDLVTASGSGLDPHISVAAANYQASRIVKARGLTGDVVQSLVTTHTQGRMLGFLGEPRVNVLQLNLALDDLVSAK